MTANVLVSMPITFTTKVQITDTCWLWTGAISDGYGHYWLGHTAQAAHLFLYRTLFGDVPPGREIDHICRIRRCVRPDHLQAVDKGTNHQNLARTKEWSRSGVRGVTQDVKSHRWRVRAMVGRKSYYGGQYDTVEEADRVAVELRNRLMVNNLQDRLVWRPE